MSNESIIDNVKTKAGLVRAHAPDVIKTGAETLNAAKGVVLNARDELKRTLKEGADKIVQKLQNIATPTRKEAAEMHKAEIKAKKRAKRAAEASDGNGSAANGSTASEGTASASVGAGSARDAVAKPRKRTKTKATNGSATLQ